MEPLLGSDNKRALTDPAAVERKSAPSSELLQNFSSPSNLYPLLTLHPLAQHLMVVEDEPCSLSPRFPQASGPRIFTPPSASWVRCWTSWPSCGCSCVPSPCGSPRGTCPGCSGGTGTVSTHESPIDICAARPSPANQSADPLRLPVVSPFSSPGRRVQR